MKFKTFVDEDGDPFPAPVLDDRAGVKSGRESYELAPENAKVQRLPPDVFAAVRQNAAQAEEHMLAGDLAGAWGCLVNALRLLPEPTERWNATTWLLVVMGECRFRSGKFATAIDPFHDAMRCPGALGYPWLHLRLGQACLESGDEERAADELARA